MSFAGFPAPNPAITLLQGSLEQGRLAHAYLFTGDAIEELERLARTLAKALNCLQPVRRKTRAVDCCDACEHCLKIDRDGFEDIHWTRPESRSRTIVIGQIRDLLREIHLKPGTAEYKVAIITGADRMNPQSANAFLKTLEEPPPKSVLILLTTEPQQLLDTVLSRCLRINFAGDGSRSFTEEQKAWIGQFAEVAASGSGRLLGRYLLLGGLLQRLADARDRIEKRLSGRSDLAQHADVEPETRKRWEEELEAAVEAEYRRQRIGFVRGLQWWFRDVWLRKLGMKEDVLMFPEMASTGRVAERLSTRQALANLTQLESTQRLLGTNVQEALALEVALLKLNL